jgi:hypothetical protein
MTDFDVTDSYKVQFDSNDYMSIHLKNGTSIFSNLLPNDDGTTYFIVGATKSDGTIIETPDGNEPTRESAVGRVYSIARKIINTEEPLTGDINWENSALISLLQVQERIVLCPECMGDQSDSCTLCLGHEYVTVDTLFRFVDGLD